MNQYNPPPPGYQQQPLPPPQQYQQQPQQQQLYQQQPPQQQQVYQQQYQQQPQYQGQGQHSEDRLKNYSVKAKTKRGDNWSAVEFQWWRNVVPMTQYKGGVLDGPPIPVGTHKAQIIHARWKDHTSYEGEDLGVKLNMIVGMRDCSGQGPRKTWVDINPELHEGRWNAFMSAVCPEKTEEDDFQPKHALGREFFAVVDYGSGKYARDGETPRIGIEQFLPLSRGPSSPQGHPPVQGPPTQGPPVQGPPTQGFPPHTMPQQQYQQQYRQAAQQYNQGAQQYQQAAQQSYQQYAGQGQQPYQGQPQPPQQPPQQPYQGQPQPPYQAGPHGQVPPPQQGGYGKVYGGQANPQTSDGLPDDLPF